MALYEAALEQEYFGQQIINRFTYESQGVSAATTGSFALAFAMGAVFDQVAVPPEYPATGLIRGIARLQVPAVQFVSLRVINLYDFVDFYETPFVPALTGTHGAADGMPPFAAFGFRTNVVRRDIRRGTKRFVGLAETDQNNGNITGGFMIGGMVDLAARMTATLVYTDEGQDITFRPVVLGRQRYNPATGQPSETGTAYRYYPTVQEQNDHVARSIVWQPYDTVRTQNSRQYGRGR